MGENVRKWLPSEYQDEVIPEVQKSPDQFLQNHPDHGWIMLPPDEEADEESFYFKKLEPGQIIRFDATESYGFYTLTVREDRSYSVDGEIPSKANCFVVDHDIYTLQDTLGSLVEGDGCLTDPLEPGEYTLTAYWWSERPTHFRFEIDADGNGRFALCAGENCP